jgi:hypothetical protein
MSARNMELMSVDLPSPDSPTTINVNSNPFLTALRYTWLGRLKKQNKEEEVITHILVSKSIDFQFIGQEECLIPKTTYLAKPT